MATFEATKVLVANEILELTDPGALALGMQTEYMQGYNQCRKLIRDYLKVLTNE